MERKRTKKIEIAYALPDEQWLDALEVPHAFTIEETLVASMLYVRYPELKTSPLKVGIFSKACELDTVPSDGDRIEIYRPLQINPIDARRIRAGKRGKKGVRIPLKT